MKLKYLLLSVVASTALAAGAQNQGYQDGIEYFKADQFDNAKEILSKTFNDPKTDKAESLYYLGTIALKNGDVATAHKNFNEGIALAPKNGLNYVGLGAIALKSGNPKAAADFFKQATKAQNKSFIHCAIARAYYDADKVAYSKEYNKYLSSAYDKDKKEPEYFILKGDILRDQAIAAGQDMGAEFIGQAASEYQQAIYFEPKSPVAYVKYSRVYAKANPQYAINELIKLNELVPTSALAQRELAERYYDDNQWTRAAQQYGKYIENPNHFVKDKERYAVLLFFGENYDKSLEITRQGLATDPNSLQLKRLLMLNLEKKGDLAGAKAAAEGFFATPLPEGVRFTGTDYTTYANILHEMDDMDGEIAARQKAIEVNPDKVEFVKDLSIAYFQAGNKAKKEEDQAIANGYFRRAAEVQEKYVATEASDNYDLMDLANRYQNVAMTSPEESPERAEGFAKAKDALNRAIEMDSTLFTPFRMLARLSMLENGGKSNEETVAAYTKVLENLDQSPSNREKRKDVYNEAYTYIAAYYILQKDIATAKSWYEKMLELDPENQALRDYIDKMKE